MTILENYDLTKFNSFGVPAKAKFFTEISSEAEIKELIQNPVFQNNARLFLGGGSNLLFTQDFDGIVVLNKLKGIEVISADQESALVKAMAGEVWQDLVEFAIDHNLWGIENMSYIPGSVGAAPMQNIGAYGQDLQSVFVELEAFDLETGEKKNFNKEACCFGYRDSFFKKEPKGKYLVVSITLRLSKKPNPNLEYKGLNEYFKERGIEEPSLREISQAVGEIRHTKLPDPSTIGNAGSFFKNAIVNKEKLEEIQREYPDVRYYPEGDQFKIPSAWLIETAGPDSGKTSPDSGKTSPDSGASWKGYRDGNVGVYENHALVIVNHGSATGAEVVALAEKIQESVKQKFGITLIPEVNFI